MKLILNGINGRYLREITENATGQTEYVEAAVAYVTDESLKVYYLNGVGTRRYLCIFMGVTTIPYPLNQIF